MSIANSPLTQLASQAPKAYEDAPGSGGLSQLANASESSIPTGDSPDSPPQDFDPSNIEMLARMIKDRSAQTAYQDALLKLSKSKPRTGRLSIPALQFAAGLLQPTKGGGFGEAVSNAAGPALQSLMQERALETGRSERGEDMQLAGLKAGADSEQGTREALMRLMGTLGGDSFTYSTADGIYRRNSSGTTERLGDLRPNQAEVRPGDYEKEADKLAAGRADKYFTKIQEEGDNALKQNQSLESFTALMDTADLQGAAAPMLNRALSFAESFGLDPKVLGLTGAGSGEAMRGISSALVLDRVGGSLGVGFSDADRGFVESIVPRFGNVDKSNIALSEILRRVNDRSLEVARFAQDYAANNPRLVGIRKAIRDRFGEQSIFDKDFTKEDLKSLITDKNTMGDLRNKAARAADAAVRQAEIQFRNGEITSEERDTILRQHGIILDGE